MSSLVPQRLCEIWIGRAGSGKTYGCLDAIAKELIRSPRGRPLLLLTPEQATAQMERRLATWPGIGAGFTRARVLSFERLARLALAAAAEPPPPTPGETGRVLALRRALRRHRDDLLALKASADQDGMAEAVGRALTELARYGWTPDSLDQWLEPLSPADRLTLPLARKTADLARLWRDYQNQLRRAGWEDQPAHHAAATRAVAGWEALDGCQAWLDGFASFTVQELELLEALLARADGVTLALCADPGALAPSGRVGPGRLFDNALETLRQLEALLGRVGWTTRRVALPRSVETPTRFAVPALAHLENHVLGRLAAKPFLPKDVPVDEGDWTCGAPSIELIEATDRRAEVQAVARRVASLCRRHAQAPDDGPPVLAWRQVGVVARDLGPYAPLIRELFGQFEIPFFLDRPREIVGHPLARLLLAALSVLRGGWGGRDVIHYLKSGLAWPASGSDAANALAKLENHVLGHDPRRRGWMEALAALPELHARWRTVEAPLAALGDALRVGGNPARFFWDFLDRLGAAATLDAWIAQARAQGDEEQAQLHEQAWSQALGWLEDLGRMADAAPEAFGPPADEAAWRERLDELAALLGSALAATRARLVPPTLNQVTVGAIDRSRSPELAVAFVLGLNEGEFPRAWRPDPLLNDADREMLTRPGDGRHLGPDSLRLGLQEHYFVYIALTRASHAIVLSRPLADDVGKPAAAATVFGTVAEAFPTAPRRLVGPDGQGDAPALGLRPDERNRRLASALAAVLAARAPEGNATGRLASIMATGDPLDLPGIGPAQREALLVGRRDAWVTRLPRLSLTCSQAFWDTRPTLSVTNVEVYGQCPFKFFARAMLRLKSRDRAGLTPQDLGTLRHHVLESLFKAFRDASGLRWNKLDLAAADRLIDAEIAEAKTRQPYRRALQAGQMQALKLELAARDVKRFIRVLSQAAARGDLTQVASERKFELTLDALGPCDRTTPLASASGATSPRFPPLVGTIDRVDRVGALGEPQAWIVFDYKSGRPKFHLTRFLSGVDMQLGTYALAVRALRGDVQDDGGQALSVGGFFYWSLATPPPQKAGDAPDGQLNINDSNAPSGVFVDEWHAVLDHEVTPGGPKSPFFRFKLTAKGAINRQNLTPWPREAFDRLLLAERRLLEHALRAIMSGQIAPRPSRQGKNTKACQRCDYLAFCRLNAWRGAPPERLLSTMSRKTAMAWLDQDGDARDPFTWPAPGEEAANV